MKKLIIKIAIAAFVLLIVALVAVYLSLNTIVKKAVESYGPQLTKVEVKLDSAKITPFGGLGELSGLFIGNPEGYKTESAIKVGDIKMNLKLRSVFSDTVQIESIKIKAPEITFEGGLSGNNLSKILDNLNSASASGGQPTKSAASGGAKSERKYFVKDVVVEGGKINLNLNLAGLGGKATTIPLPTIHLQNIGSERLGVSAAELGRQLLQPLVTGVIRAATENATGLGKNVENLGKDATEKVNEATKGLKGLFGK